MLRGVTRGVCMRYACSVARVDQGGVRGTRGTRGDDAAVHAARTR